MTSTAADLRDAAVAYHALGWRLVPVEAKGKRPTDGDEWQTERHRRTVEQVRAHWARAFNIGVMLGPASGELVDVDLDCPEAIAFADAYLPAGAFVFGRVGAPRSHRLYRAPGAHFIQLRDPTPDGQQGSMLVELRAKPAGGAGVQTVLPPSTHKTGERIEWDADAADAQELPALVDAAELTRAVRSVAVAACLARHLGGVEAARRYLAAPEPGQLKPELAAHVRTLGGLGPAESEGNRARRTLHTGNGGPLDRLRAAGIENAAALLGLQWDDRRRALVVCPGCRRDTRSDHDKRAAAGTFKATDTGVELWTHGKCGTTGDAITLVAAEVVGTLKPTREQFKQLVAHLRALGWT